MEIETRSSSDREREIVEMPVEPPLTLMETDDWLHGLGARCSQQAVVEHAAAAIAIRLRIC